jgi:hypothetical protein
MLMRERFGLGAAANRPPDPPRRKRPPKPPAPRETATWPDTCLRPRCPTPGAPVVPGRACCEACAARIDARARELREREP